MVNLLVKFIINVIILISILCNINRLEVISPMMFYMELFILKLLDTLEYAKILLIFQKGLLE